MPELLRPISSDEVDRAKRAAARLAAELVHADTTLGLGTGSTAERFLEALAERVKGGLRLGRLVATSEATAKLGHALGLEVEPAPEQAAPLDLDVDGADAWDDRGFLIKGYGGALLREKLVAKASRKLLVVVDWTKRVPMIDLTRKVPVEVVQFAWQDTAERLRQLGLRQVRRRQRADGVPFITDEGHFILDVSDPRPEVKPDVVEFATRLKAVPGVVEHGLFCNFPVNIVVGHCNGHAELFDLT